MNKKRLGREKGERKKETVELKRESERKGKKDHVAVILMFVCYFKQQAFLNIQVKLTMKQLTWTDKGNATVQTVSRRLLTSEAGFDPRVACIGFLVDKVAPNILIFACRVLHHQRSVMMIDQPQQLRTWWYPNLLLANSGSGSCVCFVAFHSWNFQRSSYMFASIHKYLAYCLTNFLIIETEGFYIANIEASQWTRS